VQIHDRHRHEQPTGSPARTPKTMMMVGATLGFVGWLVWLLWPNVKNDFLPWLREPVRITVAAGWADQLPRLPEGGACRPETAKPAGKLLRRAESDVYETPTRGVIEIECEGRKLILDVRRVAKVTVAAPATLAQGETTTVKMQAYDMTGAQLRIGDQGKVVWRVEGPLSTSSQGAAPSSATVRADKPGDGAVMAEFDTLTGTAKIHVD
jgi:hypothetical protein